MDAGQIEIRNKQINSAFNEQYESLLNTISQIKAEVLQDSLNKTDSKSRILSFAGDLIPSVIIATVIKVIELL
jgi:hypothetical protein